MGLKEFNIQWEREYDSQGEYFFYRCREKIDRQTLEMRFYKYWEDDNTNTVYFSIMLSVHNKRKHIDRNMEHKFITGANPLKTVTTGLRMFEAMEKKCVEEFNHLNVVIFCNWLDKRRRDAYYRILSRRGYRYGMFEGEKVIMKKWRKRENDVEEEFYPTDGGNEEDRRSPKNV